jgi:hypothetical protein
MANIFTFDHRLGPEINLFAGVFVVLLGSSLPVFLPFSGFHLANIFLFLALLSLLRIYRVNSAADHIYNAGFWLGIASLFQVHYLFFLPAALVGLSILRKRSLREQLILLFGSFTPWLLAGFACFWYDAFDLFWREQWREAFGWPVMIRLKELPLASLGGWLLLLLISLLSIRRYKLKTTLEVQKKVDLLFWFLLCAALVALFNQPWQLTSLLSLAPRLGILLGLSFSYLTKSAAELWHLLLVIALLTLQLWPLLPWG